MIGVKGDRGKGGYQCIFQRWHPSTPMLRTTNIMSRDLELSSDTALREWVKEIKENLKPFIKLSHMNILNEKSRILLLFIKRSNILASSFI